MRGSFLLVATLAALNSPTTFAGEEPSAAKPSTATSAANKHSVAKHVIPEDVSRAGFILSQVDANGLLFGLPQRMATAIRPSRRPTEIWKGVDDGGSVKLTIELTGEAPGDVLVGFFRDPQWRAAEPAQVRRFPRPGTYVVDRLPAGAYYLGALVGSPTDPRALGVNDNWPSTVEVVESDVNESKLLVSTQFESGYGSNKGLFGEWGKLDPTRTITVRTLDASGKPVPFCDVTVVERRWDDITKASQFFRVATDDQGYAYVDQASGEFSLTVQSSDTVPVQMAERWLFRNVPLRYRVADRPSIEVQFEPFPTGTGRVSGRVHDQHGRPLSQCWLTLMSEVGDRTSFDAEFCGYGMRLPVTDEEGRYSIGQLAPGTYKLRVRHFDYPTHDDEDEHSFVIGDEPNAEVRMDVEVEAKELRYGLAVYEDGAPVTHGGWSVMFEAATYEFPRPHSFSLSLEPDGSFRVSLSKSELEKLIKNSEGLVSVYAYGQKDSRTNVAFKELSTDPENPTKVVVPGPNHAEPKQAKQADRAAGPVERTEVAAPTPRALDDLELMDTSGATHRLADYVDKVVLLNFFATSCGPCMDEIPSLIELHRDYAPFGLVILMICRDEEPDAAEKFARQKELPFAVLVDPEGKLSKQFADEDGQFSVPTNVVLDRRRQVSFVDTGFDVGKHAKLKANLSDLLD